MHAAALQFDVRAGAPAHNLAELERGLRAAHARGIELVVLPEMWPTSFPAAALEADELSQWLAASKAGLARLRELSKELGLAVCGSALARSESSGELPRNRLSLWDRGEEVLRYDKLHLFTPTAEHAQFSAGSAPPPVVATRFGRIGALLCYDLRFGELFAHLHRARAELVLVPAQWPDARASQWRALLLGRAVEAQAFVIGANRCGEAALGRRGEALRFPGNSLIAHPSGEALAEGAGELGLVAAHFELAEARKLRVRVPIDKDRRAELYRGWGA